MPPPNQNQSSIKQQITEKLKQANNVLVTVSNNPSVDQLAACIGLTLMLNKLGKHATAVYSGSTPSTIEFLKPEETLEKNTDSLRDFIIALDKSKADKLRYKVEDKIVKIFITPYRTSLSEKDLEFSLGDINVDAVVALGVHQQAELDQAITAHGRILHDATIISINTTPNNNLGSINWLDNKVSSLSEMVASLNSGLGKNVFDAQIATSLLTGIVAVTDRFSNNKTFSETMSISAQLIAAGANQQLVASKLEEASIRKEPPKPPQPPKPPVVSQPPAQPAAKPPQQNPANDGTLVIDHRQPPSTSLDLTMGESEKNELGINQIDIDKEGTLRDLKEMEAELANARAQQLQQAGQPPAGPTAVTGHNVTGGTPLIQGPPIMNPGTLTANSQSEGLDPTTDPLSLPPVEAPLLKRDSPQITTNPEPINAMSPLGQVSQDNRVASIDNARKLADTEAANNPNQPLEPLQALNAQPVFDPIHQQARPELVIPTTQPSSQPNTADSQALETLNMPIPPTAPILPDQSNVSNGDKEDSPSGAPRPSPSAPEVPPPMTNMTGSTTPPVL